MTPAQTEEIFRAAVRLCRKLWEYQDDGLDVPGELIDLEAALEAVGLLPPEPPRRRSKRGRP